MDPTAGGIYGLLGWGCDICFFNRFHVIPWHSMFIQYVCAEGLLEEKGSLCPHFREASVRLVGSRGATWVTWQTMGTCSAHDSASFCSMYSIQIPRCPMIVSVLGVPWYSMLIHNVPGLYEFHIFHTIPCYVMTFMCVLLQGARRFVPGFLQIFREARRHMGYLADHGSAHALASISFYSLYSMLYQCNSMINHDGMNSMCSMLFYAVS